MIVSKFIKNYLPVILLALISGVIGLQNYTAGTFLTGWDTLHPEFNFSLNFERLIFGVWRDEQGLGAVTVHSHMADLPRLIILYLTSFIAPLSFLRYLYFFLALVLGPLGVYYFLEQVAFKNRPNLPKKIGAFAGGLFYLLNLGTLQHFYAPFEMFATQYAFLPWLFLLATKFLIDGQRKNLILFALVTFLATPMAYAATLWYVYFAGLIIYSLALLLIFWRSFSSLRRLIVIILVTLIINSYWLLPNFYFLTTSGSSVPQAKINQLFSEKAFYQDMKYATFENAPFLKGFLFDWREYRNGNFVFLLDGWQKHLQNPLVLVAGWILFGFVVLGILTSLIKREKFGLALFPLLIFSLFFLVYASPPFIYIFSFLREHFGVFREGLRFPWTKFSIIVMFCYSFYFSQAIFGIVNWLRERKIIIFAFCLLSFTLLFIWMLPAFGGDLIGSSRRISIPEDYFQMFSWFAKKPADGRIVLFPTPTFWGWEYYDWGFEGAGFLWFGLRQPILVRDFDRWSPDNENFYWEISYASYSQNLTLLEKVLEKYQIHWLLVDERTLSPAWPYAIYLEKLENLFGKSNKISLAQTFGKIKIYQVDLETPVSDFVFLAQNLPVVEPKYNWNNYDRAYLEENHYFSPPSTLHLLPSSYYPFRSLFTGKNQEDLEFTVKDEGDYFLFKKVVPENLADYTLQIPEFDKEELVWVDPNDLSKVRYLSPEVGFDGRAVEVKIPKAGGYFSTEIDPTSDPKVQTAKNCNQVGGGLVKNETIEDGGKKFLRLSAQDANNCSAQFWLPNLSHKLSYLVTVESRNSSGKGLLFWLENLNIRKADLETYLPESTSEASLSYFIQPPMESDGLGYSLHFDNVSFGQELTVNDLGQISVNPVPWKFLVGINLRPVNETIPSKLIPPTKVSHSNPSFYRVEVPPVDKATVLVLSQSFDRGWRAYKINSKLKTQNSKLQMLLAPILGEGITNHVLVNNWANGWVIKPESQQTIVLLFWPQYLEFLGFILLGLLLLNFFRSDFFRSGIVMRLRSGKPQVSS